MSEKLRTCAVAYAKGIKAFVKSEYKKSKPTCPYGETKRELKSWWFAGYSDAEMGCIDHKVYDEGNVDDT
jgi:ribosome modulation factor